MAKREAAPNPGDPDSEFENLWRTHPQSTRRAWQLRNEAIQRNQPSTQKIWYIGKQNLLQRISMQEKHF